MRKQSCKNEDRHELLFQKSRAVGPISVAVYHSAELPDAFQRQNQLFLSQRTATQIDQLHHTWTWPLVLDA